MAKAEEEMTYAEQFDQVILNDELCHAKQCTEEVINDFLGNK